MMLTVEQMTQIAVDLLLGRTPQSKGKEAEEFIARLKKDIDALKKKGYIIELPFEIPDVNK
jgi:hypothetical protein